MISHSRNSLFVGEFQILDTPMWVNIAPQYDARDPKRRVHLPYIWADVGGSLTAYTAHIRNYAFVGPQNDGGGFNGIHLSKGEWHYP
jgi:hypothetical protein